MTRFHSCKVYIQYIICLSDTYLIILTDFDFIFIRVKRNSQALMYSPADPDLNQNLHSFGKSGEKLIFNFLRVVFLIHIHGKTFVSLSRSMIK